MIEVRRYQRADGVVPLTKWLAGLRDARARAKLEIRFRRVSMGIYGDVKSVGEGVLAIRLPAAIVEALDLHEGDDVVLHAAGTGALVIEKSPSAKELLARLRRFRGRLPKDFKFDRLETYDRR